MPVELLLEPQKVSGDLITEIFKLFCKAYGIEPSERDEKFLRDYGIGQLETLGGIDYRPYMGAKFFVEKIGDKIRFHGYSQPNDPDYDSKDQRFKGAVQNYLKENRLS